MYARSIELPNCSTVVLATLLLSWAYIRVLRIHLVQNINGRAWRTERLICMRTGGRVCMYVRRYHRREEQKGLTYVFVDEVHCNLVANDTFKMMKILV